MKTMTVVTVAIWLTGVSSAAALASVLVRPPTPAPAPIAETPPVADEPPPNLEHFKLPIPQVEPAKVRSQVGFVRTKKAEKRCSDFKPMNLGPIEKSVRYCE